MNDFREAKGYDVPLTTRGSDTGRMSESPLYFAQDQGKSKSVV